MFQFQLQHRVRLGKYKRDVDSIRKEGENLRAVWSPDAKLIAVIVSVEELAFRSWHCEPLVHNSIVFLLVVLREVVVFIKFSLKCNGFRGNWKCVHNLSYCIYIFSTI